MSDVAMGERGREIEPIAIVYKTTNQTERRGREVSWVQCVVYYYKNDDESPSPSWKNGGRSFKFKLPLFIIVKGDEISLRVTVY